MRIGRRRLGAVIAGFLVVVVAGPGAVGFLRWRGAGVARVISPPAGAVPQAGEYEQVVVDRAHLVALGLRSGRGAATVRTYAVPPGSPWLQARKVVATQLDHWRPVGSCADDAAAVIVECAWREPTRWWPARSG